MSQTETLLLVVMGFSLAALIFLFISRFIWSIASRFGARRLQRQTPATVAGLQAQLLVLQPQGQLAFEHVAALLRAVQQVALAAVGTRFKAGFEHEEGAAETRRYQVVAGATSVGQGPTLAVLDARGAQAARMRSSTGSRSCHERP